MGSERKAKPPRRREETLGPYGFLPPPQVSPGAPAVVLVAAEGRAKFSALENKFFNAEYAEPAQRSQRQTRGD